MRTHELARKLLTMKDADIVASIDESQEGKEETYNNRNYVRGLAEIMEVAIKNEVVFLFEGVNN